MRKLLLVSCPLLLLGLTGCSSPDSLMKDQIKLMNEMADALEKNEPETRVADIKARMDANNKKMEGIKLSEDEKKQLIERHKADLMQAMTRLQKAMMNRAMKDLGAGFPKIGAP